MLPVPGRAQPICSPTAGADNLVPIDPSENVAGSPTAIIEAGVGNMLIAHPSVQRSLLDVFVGEVWEKVQNVLDGETIAR